MSVWYPGLGPLRYRGGEATCEGPSPAPSTSPGPSRQEHGLRPARGSHHPGRPSAPAPRCGRSGGARPSTRAHLLPAGALKNRSRKYTARTCLARGGPEGSGSRPRAGVASAGASQPPGARCDQAGAGAASVPAPHTPRGVFHRDGSRNPEQRRREGARLSPRARLPPGCLSPSALAVSWTLRL